VVQVCWVVSGTSNGRSTSNGLWYSWDAGGMSIYPDPNVDDGKSTPREGDPRPLSIAGLASPRHNQISMQI
jgi:hypothetical protein